LSPGSAETNVTDASARCKTPTIAIVGGGFAGIGLAIALRRAGIESFTIYERALEVGGVWRDNRYPGCACDVPSRFYSYSFEKDFAWSEAYGRQPEILDYAKRVVAKYDIAPHIRYGVNVLRAAFEEVTRRWQLETESGETIEVDVFVSAVGLFNRAVVPDIQGRDDFAGPAFHSARWNHDIDLTGKTVAVIGTGASAVQFVPAIASKVAKLHLFQRTPQYVLPRMVRDDEIGARSRLKRRWQRLKLFFTFEWGGRRRASEKLTAKAMAGFFKYLEAQVPDPELRRKLTPDYRLGCKRVLQSNDWYKALTRANVEVIDTPIARIAKDGVETKDGALRKADVIIYGTGFSPTDFLVPMEIAGLGGRRLKDAWREGAEAYLGITVSGFPNFFMMYGPNTNAAASIIYMLENQARYIVSGIRKIAKGRGHVRTLNLRAEVQRNFNDSVQRRLSRMVLTDANCASYFRTASGKVTTNWPGFLLEYRWLTAWLRPNHYEVLRLAPHPEERAP
jgi:cation diffusion facilitator CzcD-associated flavoprotein CzcO